MTSFEKIIGPRTPRAEFCRAPIRYSTPTIIFAIAAFCLLISLFLPYWRMQLVAPQYPKGLYVEAYVNRIMGDVEEIDGLNHYIGMKRLADAAHIERATSIAAIIAMSLLMITAAYIHNRGAVFLAIPAIFLPALFILDLQLWLRHYGLTLDPHAPLSSAIKPFVPPVLGVGKVGQFATVGTVGPGFWLAALASVLIIVGFVFHRRAYKPLVTACACAEAKARACAEARARAGTQDSPCDCSEEIARVCPHKKNG